MELLVDRLETDRSAVCVGEYDAFVERLSPIIDDTIENLRKTKFREDPIGGRRYSRSTSIVSSAYKRHGQLLEHAILERLKDCSRLHVWREENFRLSHLSKNEVQKHGRIEPCLRTQLPYGDSEQTIPVDMIVFDTKARTLRAYNVKRGNGSYDGGKRRIILDGLLRTHMLLSGYGTSKGVETTDTGAHIIFYYGVCSIGEPFSLTSAQLDEHFAFPVRDAVEAVNVAFREKLHALIEES